MTLGTLARTAGLIGIGYEGRSIDEFVRDLVGQEVARLVDIRMNPISRKRGFSKTALGQALSAAGIVYEHRRELGNPKQNRAGFGGSSEELAEARSTFRAWIANPHAAEALDELAETVQEERVAILCFEADQQRCHRDVVISELSSRLATSAGSTRQAR